MIENYKETEEGLTPRFEFRVFAEQFQSLVQSFHNLFLAHKITKKNTSSVEFYLLSENNNLNIKIRDELIDIKKLITKVDSLEQWESLFKIKFPIDTKMIKEIFTTLLNVKLPSLNQNKYTKEQFISFIQSYKLISMVRVHKKRTQYTIDDLILEISDIDIEGRTLQTLCVESVNKDELQKFLKKYHMDSMKNTNYIEKIKLLQK